MKFAKCVALLCLFSFGAPLTTAQVPSAGTTARSEQIDILVDFFVPRTLVFAVSREVCNTAFRTSLELDPNLRLAEKDVPGLVDRMVQEASGHCDAEMAKSLERRQAEVREHISTRFRPADLARLSRLIAASVQEARNFKIDARPGDTMNQILARIDTYPEQERRLREAQLAFARTPGGAPLLTDLRAYQDVVSKKLGEDRKALLAIADAAILLAHRKANLLAQEKGFGELYADAPIPPLAPVARASDAVVAGSAVKINGSMLYVYSFLDVRQNEFTPKVLDNFDAALTARLAALQISSRILRYEQAARSAGAFNARRSAEGHDTQMIPVEATIARNLENERAVKTRYRLIIFPSNFTLGGAWRFYEINFTLVDAEKNQTVFKHLYKGRHLALLKNSENAEARSKKIIDNVFAELKSQGFI